jgi:hypothetical protein
MINLQRNNPLLFPLLWLHLAMRQRVSAKMVGEEMGDGSGMNDLPQSIVDFRPHFLYFYSTQSVVKVNRKS